jgi:hypothetical protein
MKYSSNYSEALSKVIEGSSLEPEEQEKIKARLIADYKVQEERLERQFDLQTKKWLSALIAVLFGLSYIILISTLATIFYLENNMITSGKLNSSDRTINSKVVMVLIGGTITQTAVAFVSLSKYFFFSERKNKKLQPGND